MKKKVVCEETFIREEEDDENNLFVVGGIAIIALIGCLGFIIYAQHVSNYYLVPKPSQVGVTLQSDEYCVQWVNVTEWKVFDRKEYCGKAQEWNGYDEDWFRRYTRDPLCQVSSDKRPFEISYNDDVPKCLKAVKARTR